MGPTPQCRLNHAGSPRYAGTLGSSPLGSSPFGRSPSGPAVLGSSPQQQGRGRTEGAAPGSAGGWLGHLAGPSPAAALGVQQQACPEACALEGVDPMLGGRQCSAPVSRCSCEMRGACMSIISGGWHQIAHGCRLFCKQKLAGAVHWLSISQPSLPRAERCLPPDTSSSFCATYHPAKAATWCSFGGILGGGVPDVCMVLACRAVQDTESAALNSGRARCSCCTTHNAAH